MENEGKFDQGLYQIQSWVGCPKCDHADQKALGIVGAEFCPKELTDRRRAKDFESAVQMVRAKEAAMADAPPDTAPRGTHAFTRPVINSSVGPAQIPD